MSYKTMESGLYYSIHTQYSIQSIVYYSGRKKYWCTQNVKKSNGILDFSPLLLVKLSLFIFFASFASLLLSLDQLINFIGKRKTVINYFSPLPLRVRKSDNFCCPNSLGCNTDINELQVQREQIKSDNFCYHRVGGAINKC